ncbi:MAG: histone deacetylase, partial [Bradymonadaceae bacterium]
MPSLFFDDKMIEHDPGARHPERPDRLRAIRKRLRDRDDVIWQTPEPVEREWLERVHADDYVDRLLALRGDSRQLDPDTIISPPSIDAAELAAGAVCDGVDTVCGQDEGPAFALVRP